MLKLENQVKWLKWINIKTEKTNLFVNFENNQIWNANQVKKVKVLDSYTI